MNFEQLEHNVIQWAKDRQIIPNSNPLSQGIKTLEEVTELLAALNRLDRDEAMDAYGDVMVTLIIGSYLAGMNLTECLQSAYDVIKDRKGYLNTAGIFIKQTDAL